MYIYLKFYIVGLWTILIEKVNDINVHNYQNISESIME